MVRLVNFLFGKNPGLQNVRGFFVVKTHGIRSKIRIVKKLHKFVKTCQGNAIAIFKISKSIH